jgi:hypothetical protein
MRNGSHENEPLSEGRFESFIVNEWKPHTKAIDVTMRTLADSMSSIAKTFSWAAKALMTLLVLLILLNGSQTFINQLKDTGTNFKGHIGGANGAAIELHQEKNK